MHNNGSGEWSTNKLLRKACAKKVKAICGTVGHLPEGARYELTYEVALHYRMLYAVIQAGRDVGYVAFDRVWCQDVSMGQHSVTIYFYVRGS